MVNMENIPECFMFPYIIYQGTSVDILKVENHHKNISCPYNTDISTLGGSHTNNLIYYIQQENRPNP